MMRHLQKTRDDDPEHRPRDLCMTLFLGFPLNPLVNVT